MSTKYRVDVEVRTLTQKFTQGMNTVDRRLKRSSRNFTKFAGVLGGLALGAAAKKSVEFADNIAKLSKQVGVSAQEYQKLSFATSQAGVQQSTLNTSLVAFVKRVGELKVGTGPLVTFLNKYNTGLKDALVGTTSQEQALKLIFTAMNNAGSATEKAAIANAAFSRTGVRMALISKDYENLAAKAQRLGIVLSDQVLAKAESASDAMDLMSKVIRSQLVTAFSDLFPIIIASGNAFVSFAEKAARAFAFVSNIGSQTKDLDAVSETTRRLANIVNERIKLQQKLNDLRQFGAFDVEASGADTTGQQTQLLLQIKKLGDEASKLQEKQKQLTIEGQEGFSGVSDELQKLLDKMSKGNAPIEAIKKQTEELTEAQKRYNEQLSLAASVFEETRTPAEQFAKAMGEINKALFAGAFEGQGGYETYLRKVIQLQTELARQSVKTTNAAKELDVFADQAARNMQDVLAGWLSDWDDGLSGLVSGFADALRQMAAQAIAADIFGKIGGGGSSGSSGVISGLLGLFGSAATGSGPADTGLSIGNTTGSTFAGSPVTTKSSSQTVIVNQTNTYSSGVSNETLKASLQANKNDTINAINDGMATGGRIARSSGAR